MTTKKTKPVKKVVKKKIVKKIVKKMTADEKRIAIAKDTIKWLGTKAIKAEYGNYFYPPVKAIKVDDRKDKLDVALKTVQKACRVCALGSMFYSMVRRFDGVPVGIGHIKMNWLNGTEYFDNVDGENIYATLGKYFSKYQLCLIESAFERRNMYLGEYRPDDYNYEEVKRAIQFSDKGAAPRLRAIMNNIIENKGTFRP